MVHQLFSKPSLLTVPLFFGFIVGDTSPLQQLLVEGGVWDRLPSIALKRKHRLEKQLTNCEGELKGQYFN